LKYSTIRIKINTLERFNKLYSNTVFKSHDEFMNELLDKYEK